MAAIRGRDTRPELAVRRLVHGMGFRYRLHGKGVVGRPDLVFPRRRKAIFVHGCFWHFHEGCSNYREPKSRLDFWHPKLRRNRERDLEVQRRLASDGWEVLVVWECEIGDTRALQVRLRTFLEADSA
jgi:DNA mismatch endonuclease (patch repair protein)